MPLDKLGIYDVASGVTDTIGRLKSYKVPSKWAGWIAWQTEPLKEKPAAKSDTAGNGGQGSQETANAGTEGRQKVVSEAALRQKSGRQAVSEAGYCRQRGW